MPIVLFSDCGTNSPIPALMRGVIAGIAPDAPVIDLSHGIDARDLRSAALLLMRSVRYFPIGTIFCVCAAAATSRPVVAQAGGYVFVAPDNGILSYALYSLPQSWAMDATDALDGEAYQGWEILTSVAALIHAGAPMETLGEPLQDMAGLPLPRFDVRDGWLHGEIMTVESGGLVRTSLGLLRWLDDDRLRLRPLVGEGVWTISASAALVAGDGWQLTGIHREAQAEASASIDAAEFLTLSFPDADVTSPEFASGQVVRLKIE